MNKAPLVSVIIPTINRANMLSMAIKSVLNQTYLKLEVVVIASSCIDNTIEMMKLFENDNRIIFRYYKEKLGGAKARNIGVNLSNGEFIAFLDDDDFWEPNKIVEQLNVFNKYPDCDLVYSNFFKVFPEGKRNKITLKKTVSFKEILKSNYVGSFSFAMIRKIRLGELRIDNKLSSCQDWDLWTKILSLSSDVARNSNCFSVNYRLHLNNRISTNRNSLFLGHNRWFELHKGDMNAGLKRFHKIQINDKNRMTNNIYRLYSIAKFAFKFPLKIDLTIILIIIFMNEKIVNLHTK